MILPQTNIIQKAAEFAQIKHKGQMRKFENMPYFIHPKRVAHILYQFKVSQHIDELIASAYLHDTVEDTDTSIEEIKHEFGGFIANLVNELTSSSDEISKVGKAEYLANKMINMTPYALALKLADRIDNVNRLQWQNEKFKNKYLKETFYIVSRLEKERSLSGTHRRMINEIKKHISPEAVDNIDYLSFDSYMRRSNKNEFKESV